MNTNHDIKKGEQAMEKNRATDRNRAKGMLWGLIVGDAFGSPIQFSGKDDHPWITEMEPCPVFNLGGDSDSIGAVFGQIAGAYYGFDAIPERWVKAVKTWEKVDALIERFLSRPENSTLIPDFCKGDGSGHEKVASGAASELAVRARSPAGKLSGRAACAFSDARR